VFILGSCIGSFLNVCIYRMPKEKSIVRPASYCPKCNKPLRWYDNIPLLSYIILKGKCRDCKGSISFRYPLVELITALFFLGLYMQLGLSPALFKMLILFSLLLVVSFIDIEYHAIPVHLCFLGIIIALLFSLYSSVKLFQSGQFDIGLMPIYHSVKGLLFGLGFTYLFKLFGDIFIDFYLKLRKKESIEGETESLGLGDVDFMGMVGAFLGVTSAAFGFIVLDVLLVFFIAPFIAVVYSIVALFFKKSHLIPYLPYLSLATVITYFYGNRILSFIF